MAELVTGSDCGARSAPLLPASPPRTPVSTSDGVPRAPCPTVKLPAGGGEHLNGSRPFTMFGDFSLEREGTALMLGCPARPALPLSENAQRDARVQQTAHRNAEKPRLKQISKETRFSLQSCSLLGHFPTDMQLKPTVGKVSRG